MPPFDANPGKSTDRGEATDVAPSSHRYLTEPPPERTGMPFGIIYIVGNELAERFSFYGMKAILTVFMTQYLLNASGALDTMNESQAKFWVHTFIVAAYFTPIFGAILADWLLGKYRTILLLSIVYCLGHLTLAIDESRWGLAIGLSLIAIGTGAIKPCVSAHVGDQFGPKNSHLLGKVYGWFYLSINLGSFVSTLLTPWLLENYGGHVAFGVPGILMAIATFVFWLGRNQFVHVPPRGDAFWDDLCRPAVYGPLIRLIPIFLCVAAFWCLYDQTASAWVLQAESMDRQWFGVTWLSSQLQAINPAFILVFVPLFSYVIYPLVNRVWALTPLRKIGLGMFMTCPAFAVSGLIQTWIDAGQTPTIAWQVLAYAILTAAEIMVSITCLEFLYAQAPKSMRSVAMSYYLLSVAAGNELTAAVNLVIENEDGTSRLPGASYYWFFTVLMIVAAIAYVFVAMLYRPTPTESDGQDTPVPGPSQT